MRLEFAKDRIRQQVGLRSSVYFQNNLLVGYFGYDRSVSCPFNGAHSDIEDVEAVHVEVIGPLARETCLPERRAFVTVMSLIASTACELLPLFHGRYVLICLGPGLISVS